MPQITDSKILILATNGFEQSELDVPRDDLTGHGATVHVATPGGDAITGWKISDWGSPVAADLALAEVAPDDYDALVLPGGQINPDLLRVNDTAIDLVRSFYDAGKTIAAICHAPWLLIEAGLVDGRAMTSYKSIVTDVRNAGANWQNAEVVEDEGIITSRSPDDLPAFVAAIVRDVEGGRHDRKAA